MGVPAASGYPQYSGNLITPIFSDRVLERWYASTIYSDISTTDYYGDIPQGRGDQVTFFREPKVIVRDYVKNEPLTHDTFDAEPVTLTIDRAKSFSVKMNKIDEKMMANWEQFKERLLVSAGRELAYNIETPLINEMWSNAAPYNQGQEAGFISQSINLGAPGAPLVITKENVNEVMSWVHQVLDEVNAPKEGRFMVVPPAMVTAMKNSDLKAAYLTGLSTSPLINGMLPENIAGFMIMESNRIPTVMDTGVNKLVYHIIAGVRSATAFAGALEESRTMTDVDDFANYYQGLSVYGFKVLYEEGIVHLYATFDVS